MYIQIVISQSKIREIGGIKGLRGALSKIICRDRPMRKEISHRRFRLNILVTTILRILGKIKF